jgi:hypothetical protein
VVIIGRMRWLEYLFRMQELDPSRKLATGPRRVQKPKLRWFESVEEVEEDLKNTGLKNWRRL